MTGDTTYGTLENIGAIEDAGIRAYVPLPDFDHRTPFFGKGDVAYDVALDVYRCPGGALLRPLKHEPSQPVRRYQAPAATCTVCPLKAQCTTSRRGRRVARHVDEADLERVRAYHATEAYQRAMHKRQVWVEPLFAEAKDWHGLRRFRLRGMEAGWACVGFWVSVAGGSAAASEWALAAGRGRSRGFSTRWAVIRGDGSMSGSHSAVNFGAR